MSRSGIEALLLERLGEAAAGAGFTSGVLNIPVGNRPGALILVDYCTDSYWLSVSTARLQPWLYITVCPDAASRMAADPAISRVELAEILLEDLDLSAILAARVTVPPRLAGNLDMPVYALGARPSSPAYPPPRIPRCFKVSLSGEGVRVDELLVVPASQSPACAIMQVLVTRMAKALADGSDVASITIGKLADEIAKGSTEAIDAESVRRALNRMRSQITITIRRVVGAPIDDNDIIETVSRMGSRLGEQGYRLNPRSVVLGGRSP